MRCMRVAYLEVDHGLGVVEVSLATVAEVELALVVDQRKVLVCHETRTNRRRSGKGGPTAREGQGHR